MTSIIRSSEVISLQRLSVLISSQVKVLHLTDIVLQGGSDDLYEFTRALRSHPYLTDIALVNVSFEKKKLNLDGVVCTIFATLNNLEIVHLENVKVGPNAFASVSHTHSKNLRVFKVPNNELDDQSAATLAVAIAISTTISEVDLSHNKLSDKGCLAIASALEKNSSVTKIVLDGNGAITPEQLRMISELTRRGGMPQAA